MIRIWEQVGWTTGEEREKKGREISDRFCSNPSENQWRLEPSY